MFAEEEFAEEGTLGHQGAPETKSSSCSNKAAAAAAAATGAGGGPAERGSTTKCIRVCKVPGVQGVVGCSNPSLSNIMYFFGGGCCIQQPQLKGARSSLMYPSVLSSSL
jgi:hypothetical protein